MTDKFHSLPNQGKAYLDNHFTLTLNVLTYFLPISFIYFVFFVDLSFSLIYFNFYRLFDAKIFCSSDSIF